jgi:glycosyltransferase involved in cell wall biosynthesis
VAQDSTQITISGFTYIRNGFTFGYPFLESMQCILPLVDELVVVVGNSTDGTREAVAALHPTKIKIVDTIWDDQLREGGKIFAQQANIALDACKGKWAFHIQADEVIHENDYAQIRKAIQVADANPNIEGILFDFLNFYGGYHHIGATRKWHRREVRIVRNIPEIRSYRDSQGFRLYPTQQDWKEGHKGRSLKVLYVKVPFFHYSYARKPQLMQKKNNYFNSFWHDDKWLNENNSKKEEYDYSIVDAVKDFKGTHPALMKKHVDAQDWEFNYDPKKARFSTKNRILHHVENLTGWRIGEYKNYKIVKEL